MPYHVFQVPRLYVASIRPPLKLVYQLYAPLVPAARVQSPYELTNMLLTSITELTTCYIIALPSGLDSKDHVMTLLFVFCSLYLLHQGRGI